MEKINEDFKTDRELLVVNKVNEIVQWINDRHELRCSECGYHLTKVMLEANYGNCPNCGHKIN